MLEVAHLQHFGRVDRAGSQARPDACDQLLGVERLDHVIVGAGLETLDHIGGVGLRREHDDRHTGLGPDEPAYLDAVEAGQHQVEQYEVGLRIAKDLERLRAIGAEDGLEALGPQHDADHLGERGVIVDYQNASVHGLQISRGARVRPARGQRAHRRV
jgi:hypothetical protein